MHYTLTSRREDSVTIDGLGVLAPGETLQVDEGAAEAFKLQRGLSLAQATMPEGVDAVVVLGAEGE